jgi:NAD(P)H dehydrogenase (quinone)
MAKVLVLFYSAFGYVAIVARAIAEGARSAGAVADIRRVPEIVPVATPRGVYFDPVHDFPIAVVEDLEHYDAIIVGSPTRFGRLSSQMAGFLDQAGELASRGILNGKIGGAFASPTGRSGGQDAAALSIINNLLHFGMVVVGPPYTPIALTDETGERHPSALDLEGARHQGKLIAEVAEKIWGRGRSDAAAVVPSTASTPAVHDAEILATARPGAPSALPLPTAAAAPSRGSPDELSPLTG